jgi:cytochrome c
MILQEQAVMKNLIVKFWVLRSIYSDIYALIFDNTMTLKKASMKKVVAVFSLITICYACGSSNAEVKKPISINVNPQINAGHKVAVSDTAKASGTQATAAAPAKDGKALIAGSDCLACHQETNKLVGPAYAEVAKKYKEADIPKLVKKIIDGGSGVWGEIPMPPHASLAHDDVEAMVKYILTIK